MYGKHLTYPIHLCCIQVISFLKESGVEVRDYDAVSSDVVLLQSNQLKPPADVQGSDLIWADPNSCSYALYSKLNSDKVLLQQSPLALAKAIKVVLVFPNQLKSLVLQIC